MERNAEQEAADNAAVVARLSTNATPTNLTLQSERDGTLTPAVPILLASCSPIFLQIITDSVEEEGANRGRKRIQGAGGPEAAPTPSPARNVRCAFSGDALAAVVAFSSTNDAPALWSGTPALIGEIMEAAEYYEIDDLLAKAGCRLAARARETPAEACAVLEAVWESWTAFELGAGPPGEAGEAALAVIHGTGQVALMGCGCLCEEAMERVIVSRRVGADEVGMFSALQRWMSVDEEARGVPARRLASLLSLQLMPLTFLSDVVAKSGLVPHEVLQDVVEALQ